MIRFNNVSKTFGQTKVLQEQTFQINDREFFVLVGPSGSGKTTLLKMINCLIEPSSGDILLNNVPQKELDLREMRLSIGYVLQQIALFPNLTVAENIAIIPDMKQWSAEEIRQKLKNYWIRWAYLLKIILIVTQVIYREVNSNVLVLYVLSFLILKFY